MLVAVGTAAGLTVAVGALGAVAVGTGREEVASGAVSSSSLPSLQATSTSAVSPGNMRQATILVSNESLRHAFDRNMVV